MGSAYEPALGLCKSTLGAPRIASTAYQSWPTWARLFHTDGRRRSNPLRRLGRKDMDGVLRLAAPDGGQHATPTARAHTTGAGGRRGGGGTGGGRAGRRADAATTTRSGRPRDGAPGGAGLRALAEQRAAGATPIHSSRIGRGGMPPRGIASHALLYRTEPLGKSGGLRSVLSVEGALEPSYPEGNFEGNQLLGGSIGLSPLCHTQATQFARQNSDRPPPRFPKASA